MSQYLRKYIKKDHYGLHYSEIKFKTYFNNCILRCLQSRQYRQTDEDDWEVYWVEKHLINETLDKIRLFPNKRINHFRNFFEICRKDLLSKNIKRYRRALEKQGKTEQAQSYNFIPLTFNLPSQYPIFNQEFKRSREREKAIWIMKPVGLSQGKGIFLFRSIGEIEEWSDIKNQSEAYIVQRYIHNPLLIGHKKFDMRIYVLVTSHSNLTIYLYRSGFGRFTHSRYDTVDINDLEGHLTNVAVQKNSENYDEQRGGKYQLDKLKLFLLTKHGQQVTNQCFYQIQELIIKTLEATSKVMITDKRCFQLYGFDILLDQNLKPWLMQVNGSPSMTANTPVDTLLKIGLLDDTLTIVNIQQLLIGDEQQVGGFDLIYKNKKIKTANLNQSMLGTFNNRLQQMRRMAKVVALRQAEKPKKETEKNTKYKSSFTNNPIRNPQSNPTVKTNHNIQSLNNKVKLPKVTPPSNKVITDNTNARNNQLFRITQSKQSKR